MIVDNGFVNISILIYSPEKSIVSFLYPLILSLNRIRDNEPRPLPLKGVVTWGESKHKIKDSLGHALDSAAVKKGRTCGWVPKWFFGYTGSLIPSPLKFLGKDECLPLYLSGDKKNFTCPALITILAWPGHSGFLKFSIPNNLRV